MDPTLVPLAHDSVLERIRPEIYSRGNDYVATDQRKTFLILNQKLNLVIVLYLIILMIIFLLVKNLKKG